MGNVVFLYFSFKLKFDNLVEMVCFRRISLFDYNFDDELAFEYLVCNNRHINDFNLNNTKDTSSLLTKSTAGVILSARPLINN